MNGDLTLDDASPGARFRLSLPAAPPELVSGDGEPPDGAQQTGLTSAREPS
jgi:hypothetical protein